VLGDGVRKTFGSSVRAQGNFAVTKRRHDVIRVVWWPFLPFELPTSGL
jgi:hypothetical protein